MCSTWRTLTHRRPRRIRPGRARVYGTHWPSDLAGTRRREGESTRQPIRLFLTRFAVSFVAIACSIFFAIEKKAGVFSKSGPHRRYVCKLHLASAIRFQQRFGACRRFLAPVGTRSRIASVSLGRNDAVSLFYPGAKNLRTDLGHGGNGASQRIHLPHVQPFLPRPRCDDLAICSRSG